jgi:hypothetical protein
MMHARAAENTNISFEGMLSHTELAQMEGVGHEESDVLKRSTLQPKRDFRILPLTPQNVSAIVKAITSKIAFGNSLHHCVPRMMGGSRSAENRVLLHPECHDRVHRQHLSVLKPRLPERGVRRA